MCLARGRADAGIDRVCDLRAKSKIEGRTTIPRVADYALSHEFDDLRGECSDLPVRSDDSDDSSESESRSQNPAQQTTLLSVTASQNLALQTTLLSITASPIRT